MKKRMGDKFMALLPGIMAGILLTGITALAEGTVTMTVDKASVQIADTVTVSVKASEPEDPSVAPQIRVTYDTQLLEYVSCDVDCGGGGGLLTLSSTDAAIQFKALSQGTANVSVEAILGEDGNDLATGTASVAVGAAQSADLSSDATLRGLSVNPGTLTPAFSPAVTDYTILVGNDVTDITVSGGVSEEHAQITAASGFKNLKEGENQAVITITAQDGSTLTYHFTITREDGQQTENAEQTEQEVQPASSVLPQVNPLESASGNLTFQLDDITYQVSRGFDSGLLPQGCVKKDVEFAGQTVEGAYFEAGDLTLVYAISGADGMGDFYICDEKGTAISLFIQIQMGSAHYVVPVAAKEKVPDGFEQKDMQWNNSYLQAYQVKNAMQQAKDFYLLYAVDQDGSYGYFMYDALQGTCQRFLPYSASAGGDGKTGQKTAMIAGMLAIVIVGLLMLILNLFLRNKELMDELESAGKDAGRTPSKAGKKNRSHTEKREAVQKEQKETQAENQTAEAIKEKTEETADEMPEASKASRDEVRMQIEITSASDDEAAADKLQKEQEAANAAAAAMEEKQKAARRAALEREIAKDEKARAKREAAEKKKQEEAKRQAQRLAEKQALAEQKARERLEAAEKKAQDLQGQEKIVVKKEVTDRGVTYTTGRIPVTVVPPEKQSQKRKSVLIYTLETRTVSLTREAGPDELDDDFEFEFINIGKD